MPNYKDVSVREPTPYLKLFADRRSTSRTYHSQRYNPARPRTTHGHEVYDITEVDTRTLSDDFRNLGLRVMHTPPKKRLCPTVIIVEDLPDDAVVVGVTEDIGLGGDILTCRLLVGKVETTTTVDVVAERSKVWIIHICPTRRETLGIATATLRKTSIAYDTH